MPFFKLFSFQILYKYYNIVPGSNLYVNVVFIIMGTKDTLLEGQKKQVYKTLKESTLEAVVIKLVDLKTPSHS